MMFSEEGKSSWVLSLAIAVTFALYSVVEASTDLPSTATTATTPTTTTTGERRCSLGYGGTLTLFNGERTEVRVPCKYRMANFTCGGYSVKVTPGSSVNADARYYHDKVWVKVVNTVTMETVKLRTSLRRLEKAEAGRIDNPWNIKEGDTDFLDFAGYDDGVARLKQDGVFTVQFSNNFVTVTCAAPDFASPGVPETLCGDGTTVDEVATARSKFGLTSFDVQYVQHIILNDSIVTQSQNCVALTTNLQSCGDLERTVLKCYRYFYNEFYLGCLIGIGTAPEDVYDFCVRSSCYEDYSNQPSYSICEF